MKDKGLIEAMKLQIIERLAESHVNRREEQDQFWSLFDTVLEGQGQLCFIIGEAGMGKTTFLDSCVKSLSKSQVNCVKGKFINHESKPYTAMAEAVEQALKLLLTLPADQLRAVRKSIKTSLGSDIDFLASLTPYMDQLMGKDYVTSSRAYVIQSSMVGKALYDFFTAISDYLYPLIIFIDDLQWADQTAVRILEYFCKHYKESNFLLTMSSRTHDHSTCDILEAAISCTSNHTIYLKPLSYRQIKCILKDLIKEPLDHRELLCQFLQGSSLGNPFFLKEMIHLLLAERKLNYDFRKAQWQLDVNGLKALKRLPDIQSLLIEKINQLGQEEWQVLKRLACLDGKGSEDFLLSHLPMSKPLFKKTLKQLIDDGLISIIRYEQGGTLLSPVIQMHDIVLEYVYSQIAESEKENIHTQIAKKLLEKHINHDLDDNIMTLSSQFMRANLSALFLESYEWQKALMDIGLLVKKLGLIEEAYKLFKLRDVLKEEDKSVFIEQGDSHVLDPFNRQIEFELGECAFLLEDYQKAEVHFSHLMHTAQTLQEKNQIQLRYMDLYIYSGQPMRTIELGLDILNHQNVHLRVERFQEEMKDYQTFFSQYSVNDLLKRETLEDTNILTQLTTLTKMAPAAYFTDYQLFILILLKISELSIINGHSAFAPIGYVGNSFVQYNEWRQFETGRDMMALGQKVLSQTLEPSTKPIVYYLMGIFLKHRSQAISQTVEALYMAIKASMRSGQYIYCGFSVIGIINSKYMMGTPLDELSAEMIAFQHKMPWLDQNTRQYIEETYDNLFNCLKEWQHEKGHFNAYQDRGIPNTTKQLTQEVFRLQRLFLMGHFQEALKVCDNVLKALDLLKGYILYPDCLMFCILTLSKQHFYNADELKNEYLQIMKKLLSEIEEWMTLYRPNHYVRFLLAKAAISQVETPDKRLDNLYNEAIEEAKKYDQVHLLALSHLLAANYNSNKPLAIFYASEAIKYFRQWGAYTVAERIQNQYAITDESLYQSSIVRVNDHSKDYKSIQLLNERLIEQIKDLEDYDVLRLILKKLLHYQGFVYGAILKENGDTMYLISEIYTGQEIIVYEDPLNINLVSHLSRKMIRYCARTGDTLVVNEGAKNNITINDNYVEAHKELTFICIPIKQEGVLTGLVYIEKQGEDYLDQDIIDQINIALTLININKTSDDVNQIMEVDLEDRPSLTPREKDVLHLLAKGLSNSAISESMYITLGTVKNHLSNIYSKLEAESRIQAVLKAKEYGFLQDIQK